MKVHSLLKNVVRLKMVSDLCFLKIFDKTPRTADPPSGGKYSNVQKVAISRVKKVIEEGQKGSLATSTRWIVFCVSRLIL